MNKLGNPSAIKPSNQLADVFDRGVSQPLENGARLQLRLLAAERSAAVPTNAIARRKRRQRRGHLIVSHRDAEARLGAVVAADGRLNAGGDAAAGLHVQFDEDRRRPDQKLAQRRHRRLCQHRKLFRHRAQTLNHNRLDHCYHLFCFSCPNDTTVYIDTTMYHDESTTKLRSWRFEH